MSEKRVTGPIQVFVIGFDQFEPTGKIMAELRRVRKRGVIRVIDMLFVQKDRQGNITSSTHATDLSGAERQRLGSMAGALIGLQMGGMEGAIAGSEMGALAVAERDYGLARDQLRDLANSIPNESAAAILVIEHHWATRLRNALAGAGGRLLMQAMITPQALVMVGAELNAVIEAQQVIEAAEEVKLAAAMEVAQVLVEARLIELAAISEATDVVAAAIAIEDAAAADVARSLLEADLIKEAAMQDTIETVAGALEVEDEVEIGAPMKKTEAIKYAAAAEALRELIAAEVIDPGAARSAGAALVAADIVEEAAADEAVAAGLAQRSKRHS
jgi:uncharacterized membrane protein